MVDSEFLIPVSRKIESESLEKNVEFHYENVIHF